MNMQVLLSFGVVTGTLVVAACTTIPGGTVASPTLQRDVTRMVMMADETIDSECKQRKVVNTEVTETRSDGKWVAERWTVDRCGKLATYRVTFTASPRGGTDYSVQFESIR